jgi:hypothetical protein
MKVEEEINIMLDLDDLTSLDDETKRMIEEHTRLVRALQQPAAPQWSLEQPSPFQFVHSIVTDSTSAPE